MKRVIVNDSSALIDLQKGGLLELFLALPYEFLVLDILLNDELLSFTNKELRLMRHRMMVTSLDGGEIDRVAETQREVPQLTIYDCGSLVLSQRDLGGILLVGDRRLRKKAEGKGIDCRGVLWIVEQLRSTPGISRATLMKALHIWSEDPTVRLPAGAIDEAILGLKR